MRTLIEQLNSTEGLIVIAYRNSNDEIEYTTYKAIDGGMLGSPDSDIGAIVASEANIIEYDEYQIED